MNGNQKETGEDFSQEFEAQKRSYFFHLGLQVREGLKLHKAAGLWQKDEQGRTWKNVTEHCLAEVARSHALSDLLGLPQDLREDLALAAALHDFNKEHEIAALNQAHDKGQSLWQAMEEQSKVAEAEMQEARISKRVIEIMGFTGLSFEKNNEVANKKDLSAVDLACLAIHYIDDISSGSNWVRPVELTTDGIQIDELDRRFSANQTRAIYAELNEDSKNYLKGEDELTVATRVGHLVEARLADVISQRQHIKVEPKLLPEFIDETVRRNINSYSPPGKALE
jgi:hypothetical protein